MVAALLSLYAVLLLIQVSNIAYVNRSRAASARGGSAREGSANEGSATDPSVSVIIPARNEEDNLRRLLPSVLGQKYRDFEVIVYDDDSGDDTPGALAEFADDRLHVLRGTGPPEGWVGKVHALHEASKTACGDLFLFLDADAVLKDDGALGRIVRNYRSLGPQRVLTGFTDLRGGGRLLVSVVPHTILSFLPATLGERLKTPLLASLNGQCWMIGAITYRRLRPHEHVAGEVLEDVMIGRFLKREGIHSVLVNVRREVSIYMYRDLSDAWAGFRKNAYLLMGGSAVAFAAWFVFYGWTFVIGPILHPPLLAGVYMLKLVSDRAAGMPLWITLLTPLTHAAAWVLQLDSAVSHWTGRARWKGRRVA